jgi:hypothetical protein
MQHVGGDIDGIALAMPQVSAPHSVLGFEMADDRLDGRTSQRLRSSRLICGVTRTWADGSKKVA